MGQGDGIQHPVIDAWGQLSTRLPGYAVQAICEYLGPDHRCTFEREGIERTKQITSEIAILGMNGLDINDPTQKYTLRSLPGNFSGLELLALMYTVHRVQADRSGCPEFRS